jgi:hypothetical protein
MKAVGAIAIFINGWYAELVVWQADWVCIF